MSDEFLTLSVSTQLKIDKAFDYALEGVGGDSNDYPHGFNLSDGNAKIPYSAVRLALKFLNLPQDDDDILSVLRKAAQGWHELPSINGDVGQVAATDGFISRKDWRAVCAVLMDDSDELLDYETFLHQGDTGVRQEQQDKDDNEDNEDLQGGYVVEGSSHQADRTGNDSYQDCGYVAGDTDAYNSQSSDGAYNAEDGHAYSDTPSDLSGRYVSKAKAKGKTKQVGEPTSRQKQVALEMFALFFPFSVPQAAIMEKRLTVEDLNRVAKSLKESLKFEEITEMIQWFSSSPDKTLSFDDFTRIMILAGLV